MGSRFPLHRWLVVIRLGGALAGTGLLLRLVGFKRSRSIVWRLAGRPAGSAPEMLAAIELAEARAREIAAVAERMPFTLTCLPRALLLAGLMRRRGIAADLCIGPRVSGDFDAHAWIEIDGVAINEPVALVSDLRCLLRLPTRPA